MILRFIVTIQSRASTVGTEGEKVYTFSTLKTIKADLQPITLNAATLAEWGLTDLSANSKKMFFTPDLSIVIGQRVIFGSDTFEIRNVNPWSIHYEALLIPVQGV